MNAAQRQTRRFLNGKIPARERERMNEEHGLSLGPGATFSDALTARWGDMVEQIEGIRADAVGRCR